MELFPEWVLNERRQIVNHLDPRKQKWEMQSCVRPGHNRYAISFGHLSFELGYVYTTAEKKTLIAHSCQSEIQSKVSNCRRRIYLIAHKYHNICIDVCVYTYAPQNCLLPRLANYLGVRLMKEA